jgi:ParB family chromosome partitioning protein
VPIEVSDADALEIMIIENVQRADLNAIEEARGYHALANDYRRSADDIAKVVGKSRSHVANMMRLTRLPDPVQALIANGELSAGHARALINAHDAVELAQRVVKDGLSVRQTEELARGEGGVTAKPQHKVRGGSAGKTAKDPDTVALEKRVSDALGMAVSIDHRGEGGALHVRYSALEQLDEIIRRLEGT